MNGIRNTALAILAASLALRIFVVGLTDPVLFSDARDYYVLARNLLEHHEYAQTYQGETRAFEGFTFRAFRPPGYPAALAATFAVVGPHAHSALYANVVFDLITEATWFAIALELVGSTAALGVLALLALDITWTPILMSESFFMALFSLLAAGLVFNWPRTRPRALAFGVLVAAAVFTRPIAACVFPLLALRAVRRGELRALALTALPVALAVAAWSWRNYGLFGAFVPLSTNLGLHQAREFGIDHDGLFTALRNSGTNEAAIDATFRGLERTIAAQRGVFWMVGLWLHRVAELFSVKPSAELSLWFWDVGTKEGFVPPAIATLHRLAFMQIYALYPLALIGAVVAVAKRVDLRGLGLLAVSFIVLHGMISRGDVRFMAPLYPMACLLVAALASKLPVAHARDVLGIPAEAKRVIASSTP